MLLYPLGGGCFPWKHLEKFPSLLKFRAEHNLFKSSSAENPDYFTPLSLFNGDLKSEIFSGNLTPYISRTHSGCKNNPYVADMEIHFINEKTGYCFRHIMERKLNFVFSKYEMNKRFDYFEKNKYNFIFIIDFSHTCYWKFNNKQILEFEKILCEQNFDMNNFYYLDFQNFEKFDNVKGKVVRVPNKKDCLNICDPYLKCCSCYFYSQFEKEIINRLA